MLIDSSRHHFPKLRIRLCLLVGLLCTACTVASSAQTLRICCYNMLDRPTTAAQDQDMQVVMQALGNAVALGNAQAVDILAFQEGPESAAEYSDIEANLEAVFGGDYTSSITPPDFFGCRTGFVFNTQTVQLLAATSLTGSLTHNTRRALFRPVGGTPDDDFYMYSIHHDAGSAASDIAQRTLEASIIRNNSATLPAGSAIIFCGDFNVTGSDEVAYQNLFADGNNGPIIETLNTPFGFREDIEWQDNIAMLPFHSQDPTGNMDDRFDAFYINGAFIDGDGIEYVKGSCSVLGNNGTHSIGSNINTGSGAAGFASELVAFSDHLPVFCDFKFGQVAQKFNSQISTDALVSRFVRTSGPVTGTAGFDELQIEGTSNPIAFRSFGIVDVDLSGQLADGENAAVATNIVLNLFQDNAPFTDNGPIGIYLASPAATQLTIDSSIQYQTTQNGLASLPTALSNGAVKVATYAAVHRDGPLLPDGTLDPVALFGSEIELAVADALNNDGMLRFLITPDHPATAATFAGFTSALGVPNLQADVIVDDGTETVLASSAAIVNGTQGAGTFMNIETSDDQRINYIADAPTGTDPPLRLQLTGFLPTASPQSLGFTIETNGNTPNLAQSIDLFNFNTGVWEEIESTDIQLKDVTVSAEVSGDPSRFVGPGSNLILARLNFEPAGPVLFFPWAIGIDQFAWTIVP